MKYIKLLLVVFVLMSVYCSAQESKSDLVFSGTLAHYQRLGGNTGIQGFYNYPVDPGIEVLYQYRVANTFLLSSGLCYQYGRIASWKGSENRFRFGEISLPLIFKQLLVKDDKLNLFTSFGISYGKMLNLDWEVPEKGTGWGAVDRHQNEHYSVKNAFSDLLFDVGVSFPLSNQNAIAISPYLKYRLKDYWMEYFRKDVYYGIKISYLFSLRKNE
ncbi:MAG TPA: hypothetical protein VK205_14015 [Prolixibacteraceae bacterium]|nr:hypothetical protein [Prolixibacteraceae bacterium]